MAQQLLQIHELIYTSAAQLLGAAGGHLGVVARSLGFPRELEADLTSLNGYTILPHLPSNSPSSHPSRYCIARRGANYYCVSRVVYAGADHTGRTTPLAHHVVIDLADIRSKSILLADVLGTLDQHFERAWNKPPLEFNPPRQIPVDSLSNVAATGNWWNGQLVLDAIPTWVNALLQFPATRRPIVFVGDVTGEHITMTDIARLLQLLPASVQEQTGVVSHVISPSDFMRDAAVAFTYRDSSFHTQCARRQDPQAPFVVDLNRPKPINCGGDDLAAALRSVGIVPGDNDFKEAMRLWDHLKLSAHHPADLAKLIDLRHSLVTPNAATNVTELGKKFELLRSEPAIASQVAEWAKDAVLTASKIGGQPQKDALMQITAETRWPLTARELAAEELVNIDDVASLLRQQSISPLQQDAIHRALSADPARSEIAFESVLDDARVFKQLLAVARPPLPQLCRWARQLLEMQLGSAKLMNELTDWTAISIRNPQELPQLQSEPASHGYIVQFLRPVLISFISRAPGSLDAQAAADELIRLSLTDDTIDGTIQHLQKECGFVISAASADRWINMAGAVGRRDAVANQLRPTVANRSLPPPPVPTGIHHQMPPTHGQAFHVGGAGPRRSAYAVAFLTLLLYLVYVFGETYIGRDTPNNFPKLFCVVTACYVLLDLFATNFWPVGRPVTILRVFRKIGIVFLIVMFLLQGTMLWYLYGPIKEQWNSSRPPSSQPSSKGDPRQ